jgi:hypothetical protein
MRLKALWLTTIGLSSLTLVVAMPLVQTASQFWKPEVAHAAKVTVQLFRHKSLNPLALARHTRSVNAPLPSVSLPQAPAKVLISYTLNQPLTLSHPAVSSKFVPAGERTTSSPLTLGSSRVNQLLLTEQPMAPQNWQPTLKKSLKEQQYQIKKLELQLAEAHLKDSDISQMTFNQKAIAFEFAQREFKQFLDSSKIMD